MDEADNGAVGFDRFDGRLLASDDLPDISLRLDPRQRKIHFLELVLQADLEILDGEMEGEKRVAQFSDADGPPSPFRELGLDNIPYERLVEADEKNGGKEDDDEESGDDDPDA